MKKYFILWVEGLTARTGEKVRYMSETSLYYTTSMTKAMRFREKDIESVRTLLVGRGYPAWALTFVPTSYAPPGTIYGATLGRINFNKITIRINLGSGRGGGMEIDLTKLGYPGVKMTAYQNYLGGGMLGRICNDCTIRDWADVPRLVEIAARLREHYHGLSNPEGTWGSTTFAQNQALPVSAY